MDGQIPQSANQAVIVKSSSSIFKSVVFIPVITLLLGFGLGFITKSILPLNKTPTVPAQQTMLPSPTPLKPTVDESKLPISLPLLTNPIVFEWRGSVKGKLTRKDEHSFTLVDEQGSSITITDIIPSGDIFKTLFFDKTNNEKKEVSLSALPLGSILLGDFFIFKNGPNTPVGSMFVKQ